MYGPIFRCALIPTCDGFNAASLAILLLGETSPSTTFEPNSVFLMDAVVSSRREDCLWLWFSGTLGVVVSELKEISVSTGTRVEVLLAVWMVLRERSELQVA